MKHWHFMAKIYESQNMQLINISSGVINTPNTMSAADTMGYLSNMVEAQQKQRPGQEEFTIAFEAFGLVESDDVEPSAPLTDEDIAQHRHDDKVEAQAFAASGLIGMSHKDVFDHLDGINSDTASATKIINPELSPDLKVTGRIVSEPDCVCWHCAASLNSVELAENNYECPRCEVGSDTDLTPCVNCGKIITRPGGAHYCHAPKQAEEAGDTDAAPQPLTPNQEKLRGMLKEVVLDKMATCHRCNSIVPVNGLHNCINGTMLPRL